MGGFFYQILPRNVPLYPTFLDFDNRIRRVLMEAQMTGYSGTPQLYGTGGQTVQAPPPYSKRTPKGKKGKKGNKGKK